MNSWKRVKWGVLALALAAGVPGTAQAAPDATGCFTPVGGIDATVPDISIIGNGENDARWNGGFGYGWETGALGVAEYKTIFGKDPISGQNKMYISWRRKVTSPSISGTEGIQLGFAYRPTGASADLGQMLQIVLGATGDTFNAPTPANADGSITGLAPASASLLYKQGANTAQPWSTNIGGESWLLDATRYFIMQEPGGGGLYWVIQMALPIKTTQELDPTVAGHKWLTPGIYLDPASYTITPGTPPTQSISYWADIMQQLDPVAGTVVFRSWPDPGLTDVKTPDYAKQGRDVVGSTIGTPSLAHWSSMQVGSPATSSCVGQGLSLSNSDIKNTTGTWDGGLSLYQDDAVTHKAKPFPNTFTVDVHNDLPANAGINRSDISAAFSIAPYGSQAGARSAAWAPVYSNGNKIVSAGGGKFTTVVGTQLTATTTAAGSIGTTPFTLTMPTPWTPDMSYVCAVVDANRKPYNKYPDFVGQCTGQPWLPAPQDPTASTLTWDGLPYHQCLQVELSTSGTGLTNTTCTSDADCTVDQFCDLANTPKKCRSKTGVTFANKSAFRNMYAATASEHNEQAIIDTRGLPPGKTKVNGVLGHYIYLYTETRNMPYTISPEQNPSIVKKASLLDQVPQARKDGPYSYDDLGRILPTLAIHTFWDTGLTSTIKGKKLKVLEPMSSYGNFVTHDNANEGAIYGWDASLEGVEQVAPNTYRIFVANEGRASVGTHIEALPAPRCSGTVSPTLIQDLIKSLLALLGSSSSSTHLKSVTTNVKAIQCVDLYSALDDVSKQSWGTWTSWVQLLIKEIKAASGCTC